MKIAVACDHAGYKIKTLVTQTIIHAGHDVKDLGTNSTKPVDYPDFALRISQSILLGEVDRGILLCGSGIGACIAANKIKGIYAGICHDTYSAHQGVEHDDMNVLCIGARVVGEALIKEVILSFIGAHFIGREPGQERHLRRVNKVKELEQRGNILPVKV